MLQLLRKDLGLAPNVGDFSPDLETVKTSPPGVVEPCGCREAVELCVSLAFEIGLIMQVAVTLLQSRSLLLFSIIGLGSSMP